MGTALRIALLASIIGGAYWLFNQAKSAFSYSVVRYGSPSVTGTTITLPITVRFNNPTPIAVNLDSLHADIYIQKLGAWVKAGVIDQPFSIPPGEAEQSILPRIDLGAILSGGVASLLVDISAALRAKSFLVRTDVSVSYAGVQLPTKSLIAQVAVS